MIKYDLKRFLKKIIPRKYFDKFYINKDNKMIEKSKKMRLIMVLLCKNEVDIIEDWLLFHKAIGVDGFIVTDNNSTDGTFDILTKYKNKGLILELIKEDEINYYQDTFCHRMIIIAKNKYHADWIISSDADEFWYSESLNIKRDILENIKCNVQRINVYNYYPLTDSFDIKCNNYFVTKYLKQFEQDYYDIHSPIFKKFRTKVIFKAKDYKSIVSGNHDVVVKKPVFCESSSIRIYHYYVRNYSHFVDKIEKGGKSMINLGNTYSVDPWLVLYKEYFLKNKMNKAWDEYFIPKKLNILLENGLIAKDPSISNYLKLKVQSN